MKVKRILIKKLEMGIVKEKIRLQKCKKEVIVNMKRILKYNKIDIYVEIKATQFLSKLTTNMLIVELME